MLAHLISCHLSISLQSVCVYRLITPYTFNTGVMKVRAATALPTAQITLNTSSGEGCQLGGKILGSDGRCAQTIHLLHEKGISGDPREYFFLSYLITLLAYG